MREIPPQLRQRIMTQQLTLPAVLVGAVWVLFLMNAILGLDLFTSADDNEGVQDFTAHYVIFALASTLIAAVFVASRVRTALHLATYGVQVTGEIFSVGMLTTESNLVRVDCIYEYDGRTYDMTWSGRVGIQAGDPVELIVDPHNPRNAMRLGEIYGDYASDDADSDDDLDDSEY